MYVLSCKVLASVYSNTNNGNIQIPGEYLIFLFVCRKKHAHIRLCDLCKFCAEWNIWTYLRGIMVEGTWHLLIYGLQGWVWAPITLEGRLYLTRKMTQCSNIYHEDDKVKHSIRLSKLTSEHQGFANQTKTTAYLQRIIEILNIFSRRMIWNLVIPLALVLIFYLVKS